MHVARFAFAALLAASSCAAPAATSVVDSAGADAGPDSAAAPDAAPDSAPDSAPDAAPDSAPDAAPDSALAPAAYDQPGPHAVGFAAIDAKDAARDRTVHLLFWYPTAAKAADLPTADAAYGAAGKGIAGLFAAATPECVQPTMPVAKDAAPKAGPWPLVAFSHCSGCFAASSASLAVRLASHGFAVVAADHPPNSIFETLAKTGFVGISEAMLKTRVADVRFALDVALDPQSAALPAALRGIFDASRVGVFGHSFGSMTTGLVLQTDPRPKAGLGIAAPMDTPLQYDADMAQIKQPVGFIVAEEDNSVGEIGNTLIANNFAAASAPKLLVSVADAGHFSFSDVAGFLDGWPGCGKGERQTDGKPFTYLPAAKGRATAERVVVGFFARHLRGESKALEALNLPWQATVTVQVQ